MILQCGEYYLAASFPKIEKFDLKRIPKNRGHQILCDCPSNLEILLGGNFFND